MKMKIELTKDEMTALLLDYCSNTIPASTIVEKLNASEVDEQDISQILGDFQQDWDELECDQEGFTKEQDIEADELLDRTVNQLFEEVES